MLIFGGLLQDGQMGGFDFVYLLVFVGGFVFVGLFVWVVGKFILWFWYDYLVIVIFGVVVVFENVMCNVMGVIGGVQGICGFECLMMDVFGSGLIYNLVFLIVVLIVLVFIYIFL